jgi:hypothetical protein
MSTRADKDKHTQLPVVIEPCAVYGLEEARALLGLSRGTLPREIRLRRLRVSKRAGRYLILGEWLLAWIKGGEVRPAKDHAPGAESNGTHRT